MPITDSLDLDNKIKDELQRAQSIQTESFNFFIKSTTIDIFNKYNEILPKDLTNKIEKIRRHIQDNIANNSITPEQWWQISSQRIEYLDDVFNIILGNLEETTKDIQKKAFIDQNISLLFLLICFITFISLLFVLKNIIFDKHIHSQKHFCYKLEKN